MSTPDGEPRPRVDYKALVQDDRIHASLYTDPRIFADEMERIFHRGWVFVGHASEIPRPGDYVTRRIGAQPVIMVRGRDGPGLGASSTAAGTAAPCSARPSAATPARSPAPITAGRTTSTARSSACRTRAATRRSTRASTGSSRRRACRATAASSSRRSRPPASRSLEHLGAATRLIDRSCDLSPAGEIELTAGWVKHRCAANWKTLPENDSDGYHLGFVHLALFKTVRMQYQRVVGDEKAIKAVVRDWGHGHIEIDWSPGYQGPFEWFGGASGPVVADFVAALERRDGPELARAADHAGPRARAHLPEPLPRGDQHRDRRAGGRRGVRALAHPDVLEGRARVQRPPAAHGRGGHGPRVLPDAGGPDHRDPEPAGPARAHPGVAPAEPGPQPRVRGRPGPRRSPTSPTRPRTARSGGTTARS